MQVLSQVCGLLSVVDLGLDFQNRFRGGEWLNWLGAWSGQTSLITTTERESPEMRKGVENL